MPKTTATFKKHHSSNESNKKNSPGSCGVNSGKARKRKHCEIRTFSESDLESELEECENLEAAIAIEKKLRTVAKNNSLSDEEMRKLLQKFVKNEHILALVTLRAEDEMARERREAEQRAIIITDTPSVPKLTRAKARELNKNPSITLPSLNKTPQPEIAALIEQDLHSDDDDEEYTFQEEDFMSDDDQNATISDIDSNPQTPQTPLAPTDNKDTPIKYTPDGCFKIPFNTNNEIEKDIRVATRARSKLCFEQPSTEDMRIATRTRSKLCLEQTTIEDIQSEFVPPDVEHNDTQETDMIPPDDDWMEFLNDFNKPLNTNMIGDDDDPINDPEYIAAEKIPIDAEELRDVNISRKELTELISELFEGLMNEGISLESVDLETPQKYLESNTDTILSTPYTQQNAVEKYDERVQVTRQLDYNEVQQNSTHQQACVTDATMPSIIVTQNDYYFQPPTMSTPSVNHVHSNVMDMSVIPVNNSLVINSNQILNSPHKTVTSSETAVVAAPRLDQQNVYAVTDVGPTEKKSIKLDTRYSVPYDNNFKCEYISIKRHVYAEYMEKFERLRHQVPPPTVTLPDSMTGFTEDQHNILQQQLRIHVQMLSQTFLQTYCHPEYWKWAPQVKEMLLELKNKAKEDVSFNAWNLNDAVDLVTRWEEDLSKDTPENTELMKFINNEVASTNSNVRNIPRFAPRIMDLMLDSTVFMYPQYLPRIPFTSKMISFAVFSPAEYQLIAIGLEKHTKPNDKFHVDPNRKKLSPYPRAAERMCKDTVFGKTKRQIRDHIKLLRKSPHYNPVKYFIEHKRAPPVEHELITFENGVVLPLRQRLKELPLGWQTYLTKTQSVPQQEIKPQPKKKGRKRVTASENARLSFAEFVREAVGDFTDIDYCSEEITNSNSIVLNLPLEKTPIREDNKQKNIQSNSHIPTSVIININYVLGDNHSNLSKTTENQCTTNVSTPNISVGNTNNIELRNHISSNRNPHSTNSCILSALSPALASQQYSNLNQPAITYNFDCSTGTLQPVNDFNNSSIEHRDEIKLKSTDSNQLENEDPQKNQKTKLMYNKRQLGKLRKYPLGFRLSRRHRKTAINYRKRRYLRQHCKTLLTAYRMQLQVHRVEYRHAPLIQQIYNNVKALELYSDLLIELKMFVRSTMSVSTTTTTAGVGTVATAANGCSNSSNMLGKRSRAPLFDDEVCTGGSGGGGGGVRTRKSNRQEENFRHMLLPDSAEDANRKDAIYAFNFYEKVEEVFRTSNRPEDCKKFNHILKSFDPKHDKVADLYYKLEKLFLPDHPELAQVFLTFLLPSEAAEIGKFFEYFMVTNVTTFISKLNVYFNKQPAQIRKIYNCLNELADDQNVTMKKIESKILPLLKGNQFLIDWFMQQFPEVSPPERLLPVPEYINLKGLQNNQSGEYMETVPDLLDSPTSEQQLNCQLKYINGRIFYGSKMTLPAKLSFMASNYHELNGTENDAEDDVNSCSPNGCVHGIREYGEKRLVAAAAAAAAKSAAAESNSDDNDKSEEEDAAKSLIIDTTGGEEDTSSSVETCDDATLRAHAVRLNPSYYSNTCFPSVSSASNINGGLHQQSNTNSKKLSVLSNDDAKVSPRKHIASTTTTTSNATFGLATVVNITANTSLNSSPIATFTTTITNAAQCRDKRKSPTKKTKSPISSTSARQRIGGYPMVVIHEQNSAIACAKKLKTLIEGNEEDESTSEVDTKEHIPIVARTKRDMICDEITTAAAATATTAVVTTTTAATTAQPTLVAKIENYDDSEYDMSQSYNAQLSNNTSPVMKMDIDIGEESLLPADTRQHCIIISPDSVDSDEDSKLGIVTALKEGTRTATTTTTTATDVTKKIPTPMTTVPTSKPTTIIEMGEQTAEIPNATLSVAKPTNTNTITTSSSIESSASTLTSSVSSPLPWTRDEDKIILIEMKLGFTNLNELYSRILSKLTNRTHDELIKRHQFLIDFLSMLQRK